MALKAGWYPEDDGRERYWDGERWTDAYRPGSDEVDATAPPAKPQEKLPKPVGCLAWVVGAVVLVALVLALTTRGSGDGDDAGAGYQVQSTCEDLVKKSMLNPTTVEFSEQERSPRSAYGLVTGENALGGKVTFRYACSVSGDTVRLDSLNER